MATNWDSVNSWTKAYAMLGEKEALVAFQTSVISEMVSIHEDEDFPDWCLPSNRNYGIDASFTIKKQLQWSKMEH